MEKKEYVCSGLLAADLGFQIRFSVWRWKRDFHTSVGVFAGIISNLGGGVTIGIWWVRARYVKHLLVHWTVLHNRELSCPDVICSPVEKHCSEGQWQNWRVRVVGSRFWISQYKGEFSKQNQKCICCLSVFVQPSSASSCDTAQMITIEKYGGFFLHQETAWGYIKGFSLLKTL